MYNSQCEYACIKAGINVVLQQVLEIPGGEGVQIKDAIDGDNYRVHGDVGSAFFGKRRLIKGEFAYF